VQSCTSDIHPHQWIGSYWFVDKFDALEACILTEGKQILAHRGPLQGKLGLDPDVAFLDAAVHHTLSSVIRSC
jgi:hypothetical protein